MEITGRLTANAIVNKTKSNKEVVGFNLVINDSYRQNGETKKVATYFDCSYWLSSSVVQYLTKGTIVELSGRIGANAWVNKDGEAKASITFHINKLKLLGKSNVTTTERVSDNAQVTTTPEEKDDLPF